VNPHSSYREAERLISIPDDLVVALASWSYHAKSDSLFPFSRTTVYRIVNNACRLAGIRDGRAHPHTLRHSYAVHLLREGVPVTVLRDLLGHSNFSNTLIYLRIIQPDRDMILRNVKW
jgi:site-specific recombinase XerD